MEPKVSIIVVNWNRLKDTIECLNSLKAIQYKNYNVILVDNGSSNNEAEILEEMFGDYINKFIKNKTNMGFVIATNTAIKFAFDNYNPDYILSIDNDAIAAPDFLKELIKTAKSSPDIGVVGGKIYFYDDPNRIQFVGGRWTPWLGDVLGLANGIQRIVGPKEYDRGQYDKDKEVDVVAGWCRLMDKRVIQQVGFLDPKFFFGWDDVDHCLRARKAGFRMMYSYKARIWHKNSSVSTLDGQLQYWGPKMRFYLERTYTSTLQYLSFLLFFFSIHLPLATAYYSLWVRKPWLLKPYYKGVWDGLSS